MVSEEAKQSPQYPKRPPKPQSASTPVQNAQVEDSVFSPGFKSVVAMAGWDEEALLLASLVVEDTPDREPKHKKRFCLPSKSPPQSSRRKRRSQRTSLVSAPVIALDLDGEETVKQETVCEEKKTESEIVSISNKEIEGVKLGDQSSVVSCSNAVIPCMDKLKEELSCAICLEICYEPSTTPCGHSFCKKCLRSAADKCGKKCPKCRQLISNGRSCTVNTVLWNTIQLLFPQEIESRKMAAGTSNGRRETKHQNPESAAGTSNARRETEHQNPESAFHSSLLNQSVRPYRASSRVAPRRDARVVQSSEESVRRRRRGIPSQDEDAALALRLQREEFMEAFRGSSGEQAMNSASVARANLRAMASRAMSLRVRSRPI